MHRGKRFDEVPEDYLRWVVEGRNELREEMKASARHWLEKRASDGFCTVNPVDHETLTD